MAVPRALAEGTERRGLLPGLSLNPLQDPSTLSPLPLRPGPSFTRPPSASDPGAMKLARGAGLDRAGPGWALSHLG